MTAEQDGEIWTNAPDVDYDAGRVWTPVAEQDGLDLAAVLAEHEGHGSDERGMCTFGVADRCGRCLPYRLAALALDLQGKVARVEALAVVFRKHAARHDAVYGPQKAHLPWVADKIETTLGCDPTPTATCPKVTPFKAYTEETCSRPEGHAGGCLFTSHDGRTPLEVMPK